MKGKMIPESEHTEAKRKRRSPSSEKRLRKLALDTIISMVNDTELKPSDRLSAVKALLDYIKSTNLDGNVKMLIRPEDIILSLDIFPNRARNILKGTVTNIIIEEESAKVFVDTGISIVALITRKSLNDLNIEKGTEIYAIFKTMAIKVFK